MEAKNFKMKRCSKKYIYILITCLSFVGKNSVLSLKELAFEIDENIFGIDTVIKKHILIRLFLGYLGFIIIGGIFSFRRHEKKEINDDRSSNFLIQDQDAFLSTRIKNSFSALKFLLLSSLIYAIQLTVRNFLYFFNTWKLDLWVFNFFFVYIFMKFFLNTQIYKHQLFILIFIFSITLILIIISSSIKNNGKKSFYESIINTYGSVFYIFLFYIIYIILSASTCSTQVFQKKLMDEYYVSYYKILFAIGSISILFIFISLIIVTNVSCGDHLTGKGICQIFYKDYKNEQHFMDNFFVYLYEMGDRYNSDKVSFYLEIFLVYPLYSFFTFMKYLYETLIIFHLNPNYVILSDTIYYTLKYLIILICDPKEATNYLSLFEQLVTLFGYLFYLEILELKICGLNRETKNKIYLRSILENLSDNEIDDDEEEEGGDDEKIELT